MIATIKNYFSLICLMGALFTLFSSCEKRNEADNNEQKNVPVLSTSDVTEITQTTAISGGIITNVDDKTITVRGVCWSTIANPSIKDNKTEDGTGEDSFSINIIGLSPNTKYYVRAYATNSEGIGYGNEISFKTLEETTNDGKTVDASGNVYSYVVIGNQEWFVENLKTTKYNDGTPVSHPIDDSKWGHLTSGAYAWYFNEQPIGDLYGAIYNWYAVNTGKICPKGWRVPSDSDWSKLIKFVGGENVAGGKLKSTRTVPDDHPSWVSPNTGATNEYGFSALPGGIRDYDGTFYGGYFIHLGYSGFWWSSTDHLLGRAGSFIIYYDYAMAEQSDNSKNDGFSVRCMRDK